MSEKIQQLLKKLSKFIISAAEIPLNLSNKVFPVLFVKNFVLIIIRIKI